MLLQGGGVVAAPQQLQFGVGASVYDATHKRSRGYGVIVRAGRPAPGSQRWVVKFDHLQPGKMTQQRQTSIAEAYLELPLVHHANRVPPRRLLEDVVVLLGTHKGKTGVTVRKVSRLARMGFGCWAGNLQSKAGG